jgi:hypothetical protein
MDKLLAVLGGMAAGAALMYLFDPDGGGQRRASIRDKAVGISNDISDAVGAKARHLGNKAQGLMHEGRSLISSSSPSQNVSTETPA